MCRTVNDGEGDHGEVEGLVKGNEGTFGGVRDACELEYSSALRLMLPFTLKWVLGSAR